MQKQQIPKIWLMRQAGRYLPEYREIRKQAKSFLELCYDPQKASEVTLQPVKRFDLSAAIVFSDILVTADSLGIEVKFCEGIGPVLQQITEIEQVRKLEVKEQCYQFRQVAETIKITKQQIANKPIIGFIGGSWTTCAYLLQGHGKSDFKQAIQKIYNDHKLVTELIEKITIQNINYLREQIKSGAEIVQIFESHAAIVPQEHQDGLIIKPTNLICQQIKQEFPEIKIIGFPRGSGYFYDKFIQETPIDIIGCDQHIPLKKMQEWQKNKIVQGNLDPIALLSNKAKIKEKVDLILDKLDQNRLIFNLGHGILPETDPENVKFLVDYVKSWR